MIARSLPFLFLLTPMTPMENKTILPGLCDFLKSASLFDRYSDIGCLRLPFKFSSLAIASARRFGQYCDGRQSQRDLCPLLEQIAIAQQMLNAPGWLKPL